MSRLIVSFFALYVLAGCASLPPPPSTAPCNCAPAAPPPAPPHAAAIWSDLPGWGGDDLQPAFAAFVASCDTLARKPLWRDTCADARTFPALGTTPDALRTWFESRFRPWQLVNPDGGREGVVTGYYEPFLHGSRQKAAPYLQPIYGVPDDLLTVDLSDVYPDLKGMRLRGRLVGRRVVPYASRAEMAAETDARAGQVLYWTDNAVDLFFMQIQGSGRLQLDDGSVVRLSYADQNGYPYKSVGKWLVDHGEMTIDQASLQAIRSWAEANPQRLQELLNVNPSVVFFREVPLSGDGPPGALGVTLTPGRSIAVDAKTIPLGAPVWLATTYPQSDQPLARLMLAQDTGGAIRGPVRADFYWGSGPDAGQQAGRMRQPGRMWVLLPVSAAPGAITISAAAPK